MLGYLQNLICNDQVSCFKLFSCIVRKVKIYFITHQLISTSFRSKIYATKICLMLFFLLLIQNFCIHSLLVLSLYVLCLPQETGLSHIHYCIFAIFIWLSSSCNSFLSFIYSGLVWRYLLTKPIAAVKVNGSALLHFFVEIYHMVVLEFCWANLILQFFRLA